LPDQNLYLHPSIDSVIVLGVAVVVLLVIRFFGLIAYPFKLFFTMIHEMGHIFAARFTGGEPHHFEIYQDGGGMAYWQKGKGDAAFIFPAGYLATSLFSAGLIVLSSWPIFTPYALLAVGFILLATTLVFAWRSWLTLLIGTIFGLGFIWTALNAHFVWSVLLLNILAIQGASMSLHHLRDLNLVVRHSPQTKNDASNLAQITQRSAMFWVRTWTFVSLLLFAGAVWFTWLRHWPQ
jgi:hypothetical protein